MAKEKAAGADRYATETVQDAGDARADEWIAGIQGNVLGKGNIAEYQRTKDDPHDPHQ